MSKKAQVLTKGQVWSCWVFCLFGGFFAPAFNPLLWHKHTSAYIPMAAVSGKRPCGVCLVYRLHSGVSTGILPKACTQVRQISHSPWTHTRTLGKVTLWLSPAARETRHPRVSYHTQVWSMEEPDKLVTQAWLGGLEFIAKNNVPNQFIGRSPCARQGCHNY